MTAKYVGDAFTDRFGPWAVIAGGSDGIGSAFAGELASRGLNLALIARDESKLAAMATQVRDQYGVEVDCVFHRAHRFTESTAGRTWLEVFS